MRVFKIIIFIFLIQSSCGHSKSNNHKEIYATIVNETCECSSNVISTSTPLTYVDSCFNLSIKKHYKQLTLLSIDSTSENGREKLRNELDILNSLSIKCPTIYNKIMTEFEAIYSNKTKFQGAFVSQTKIENDQYKFVLKKLATGETKEFIADSKFIDEEEIKRFLPREENIIVEYEILKDSTNKEYNKVITVSTIGAVLKDSN